MTYYKKKRLQKGIERSDLANALGIDYDRYKAIEKGEVKMPSKLIDKFNEIINRGKENDIERLNREQLVDSWWKEISQKEENGNYKLKKKMEEFNISKYAELSYLLGYKTPSTLSHYLCGDLIPPYDFKNKLYSFFENELNIQKPKNAEKKTKKKTGEVNKETNWYIKFNFNKWLEENQMTLKQFADYSKISKSTLWYIVNKKNNPSTYTIQKIKKAVDKINGYEVVNENEAKIITPLVEPMPETEKMFFNPFKERLITKYSDRITQYKERKERLATQINEINQEIYSCDKQIGIYEEIIKDIESEE